MSGILNYTRENTGEMVEFLKQLVEIESPSDDPAATGRINAFLREEMGRLGLETNLVEVSGAGSHLVATKAGEGPGVLVLCHVDTVWSMGEIDKRPFTVEGDVARGPGVFDMKGGVAQLVFALRALQANGGYPDRPITLIFNTDEEVGSVTSRDLIESEAQKSALVLVLEPAIGEHGALKTFRKGVGMFEVFARGVSAHSGSSHQDGVNAIEELARQIINLQSLTDYDRGTTVNVGVASGGTRGNVVPERAQARVDLRVSTMEEAQRMERVILGLRPKVEGASLEVRGGLNRPPMERTPAIARLFEKARNLAREELELDLVEEGTGGASDGNFTAALGVPTLDGLGAVGGGSHSLDERVYISHMAPRSALVGHLLREL